MARKYFFTILFVLIVIVAVMAGCASGNNNSDPGETAPVLSSSSGEAGQASAERSQSEPTEAVVPSDSSDASEAGVTSDQDVESENPAASVLVIYFDYSENVDTTGLEADAVTSATLREDATENNTGKLKLLVERISTVTEADVFSIEVNETYAPKYDDMVGQARQDIADDKSFTFRSELTGLEEYETVYFVTPIWWSELPQPVQVFFGQYDFAGKTIIPVVVHRGSGFGRTVSQMQEFEPDANFLDGVAINADIDNANALETINELLNRS